MLGASRFRIDRDGRRDRPLSPVGNLPIAPGMRISNATKDASIKGRTILSTMNNTQAGSVLVVGATGKVGSVLVRLLEQQAVAVRAASRTPLAQMTEIPTTQWIHLDLERSESFDDALQGVSTVFMMARPGDEHPENTAIPLMSAMKRSGVKRVINLTAMGCEMRPDFGLRRVELALEGSGMAWTHLRPNFFMQILCAEPHFAQVSRLRQIRLPAGDAAISFIDAQDVAAVAAKCIVETGHDERAYTLTGGEGLTHGDITAAITEVANGPITYTALTEDEARVEFAKAGLPTENVERLIGFYRIVRTGLAGVVSPDVQKLLGRAPRTFAEFVAEHPTTWNVP